MCTVVVACSDYFFPFGFFFGLLLSVVQVMLMCLGACVTGGRCVDSPSKAAIMGNPTVCTQGSLVFSPCAAKNATLVLSALAARYT